MSPEKSSIDTIRSLGPTSEQMKQSRGPEWKSEPPDIRMQINNPFGPSDPNAPTENGHELENVAEAESRRQTRKESLPEALISSAENPEDLFEGLRLLEMKKEDSLTPANLEERYTPPRILDDMKDRAEVMKYTIEKMEEKGWISDYNPITGEATLNDTRRESLAVKIQHKEKGFRYETKYFFGTNESRKELEAAYKEAIVELEARDILNEIVGVRMDPDVRDGLEYMVRMLHSGRTPKFKAEHLQALFNLRSFDDMAEYSKLGRELDDLRRLGARDEKQTLRIEEINRRQKELEARKGLGGQAEEGVFLNLIMLNCGSRQRMLDFLDRPGSKFLIAKLAKESGMTYDEWKLKNIGDVDKWDDDTASNSGKGRILTDEGPDSFELATWRQEANDGRRGTLTKWGNIAAWGGGPAEFSAATEKDYIEKSIGGLIGSEEAAWLACMIMRATGTYASEGYVTLPNGETHMPLGEGRFITGDDAGKFHVLLFNKKEGLKGHTSGLKDLIGRVPDMAMNLFDWAQVVVEEPDKNGNLVKVKRSIWDAWLGTKGGKQLTDLLTGKLVTEPGKVTNEEPYHKLGDIDFTSLERDFHITFSIMQWLMGNAEYPTGVFIDLKDTKFRPESMDLDSNKGRWKYIRITQNLITSTQGSTQLYDLGPNTEWTKKTFDLTGEGAGLIKFETFTTKAIETIQRRLLINILAARVLSSNFALQVMPQKSMVYNTGTFGDKLLEIPTANLIRLWCLESFKAKPKDQEEIVAHYLDDLARYQKLTSWDEVGKFRLEAEKWLNNDVGRVIGRKTI
jgi:hypothetical protein